MQKGGFRGSCNYSSLFFGALILALAALLSVGSLAAQTAGTGTISGTISDPSGAAIGGATVDVISVETGIIHTITTETVHKSTFALMGHAVP